MPLNPHRLTRFATKLAQRKLYVAVVPNPHTDAPGVRLGRYKYHAIKIGDGGEEPVIAYTTTNPNFAYAVNNGKKRTGKQLEKRVLRRLGLKQIVQHEHKSEWFEFPDSGKRDHQGRSVSHILIEVSKRFPSYDFDTKKGFDAAVEELVGLFSGVMDIDETKQ